MLLHQSDSIDELAETFQRIVLSLDRNQHLMHRTHGINYQQAEAWRAIDNHVVVVLLAGFQKLVNRGLQKHITIFHIGDFQLGTAQIDRSWNHIEQIKIRACALDFGDGLPAFDHVVHRRLPRRMRSAQRGRRIALRIHIDQQHLGTELSQRSGKIHGRRGFANATLLVGDRDQARLLRLWANGLLQGAIASRFVGNLRTKRRIRSSENSFDGFRCRFHRCQVIWSFRSSHTLAFLTICLTFKFHHSGGQNQLISPTVHKCE